MAKLNKMKLTAEQKAWLKNATKENRAEFIQDGDSLATVCAVRDGNFYRISAAYCSAGDKYNAKRGRFISLTRLICGECISIPAHAIGSVATFLMY